MKIVIVDSSQVVLRMISNLLEPRGHQVLTFTESNEALDYVTNTPSVRVLITSMEVRPMTGLELCWAARLLADARRPLHVIMMSSVRNTRNFTDALDSGADDFIEKPPGAEELYARLRAAERLTNMQDELIRLAETDPLTNLLNRRAFFGRVSAAVDRAEGEVEMSAIIADIDHFKRINDQHGHDVGDAAIEAVSNLIRSRGIVGRLGGEEFAIVLPETGPSAAESYASRLRMHTKGMRIKTPKGTVRFTCSFGISSWEDGDTVDAMLKRADIALYEAKTSGRDRVVVAAGKLSEVAAG